MKTDSFNAIGFFVLYGIEFNELPYFDVLITVLFTIIKCCL